MNSDDSDINTQYDSPDEEEVDDPSTPPRPAGQTPAWKTVLQGALQGLGSQQQRQAQGNQMGGPQGQGINWGQAGASLGAAGMGAYRALQRRPTNTFTPPGQTYGPQPPAGYAPPLPQPGFNVGGNPGVGNGPLPSGVGGAVPSSMMPPQTGPAMGPPPQAPPISMGGPQQMPVQARDGASVTPRRYSAMCEGGRVTGMANGGSVAGDLGAGLALASIPGSPIGNLARDIIPAADGVAVSNRSSMANFPQESMMLRQMRSGNAPLPMARGGVVLGPAEPPEDLSKPGTDFVEPGAAMRRYTPTSPVAPKAMLTPSPETMGHHLPTRLRVGKRLNVRLPRPSMKGLGRVSMK